eukprot:149593_1
MDAIQKRECLVYGYIREQFEVKINSNDTYAITFMPSSIKNLCIEFFGSILFDSNILSLDEECILDDIMRQNISNPNNIIEYRLLYRASEHEYLASKYHELCDQKSSTITIIHNEHNHVFGGYFAIAWEKQPAFKCKRDPDAILFLLRSSDTKCNIPKVYHPMSSSSTIRYYPNDGPIFGDGLEICIKNKCNTDKSNYCRPGYGYHMDRTNEMCGGNDFSHVNGAHWKYLVVEYEIFQICNKQ